MGDNTPRRRLFADDNPAAPASPLKPRPSDRELNPADHNRVREVSSPLLPVSSINFVIGP
jgi:hypothetical protein